MLRYKQTNYERFIDKLTKKLPIQVNIREDSPLMRKRDSKNLISPEKQKLCSERLYKPSK